MTGGGGGEGSFKLNINYLHERQNLARDRESVRAFSMYNVSLAFYMHTHGFNEECKVLHEF